MNLNKQQEQLLTELASMSANGNDTLHFQKLESKYKLVIQELIEQSGIEKGVKNFDDIDEWGICFGVKNEGVLTILKNTNGCLISVITPTDGVGRNWMHNEEENKKGLIPKELIEGKKLVGEEGIYKINHIPTGCMNLTPDYACICEGNGLELALGWTIELEEYYIFYRTDLRNAGVKIIFVIEKNKNLEYYKEKYFKKILETSIDENRKLENFPIKNLDGVSIVELEMNIRTFLFSNEITAGCFASGEENLCIVKEAMTNKSMRELISKT